MLCIFMVFSLVWKHRYTVNNSRTCFNWPPNFVWIAAQLNPGLTRNENKCIAPTRLPPCQLDHSALEKKSKSEWRSLWGRDDVNTSGLRQGRNVYPALAIITFLWYFPCNTDTLWATVRSQQDTFQLPAKCCLDCSSLDNSDNNRLAPTSSATIQTRPPTLGQKSKSEWRSMWSGDDLNSGDLRVWRSVYLALIIIVFLWYFPVVWVTYLKIYVHALIARKSC